MSHLLEKGGYTGFWHTEGETEEQPGSLQVCSMHTTVIGLEGGSEGGRLGAGKSREWRTKQSMRKN